MDDWKGTVGSERSRPSNCARPANGGEEGGKVGAGGGPLIPTGVPIVSSTSDDGDKSQYSDLNPKLTMDAQ